MITYNELRKSIEEDIYYFFKIPQAPYNTPAIHLQKRINDYLNFKLKWLYAKEKPSTKEEIDKLKQTFHDEYLNMLEEYCLSFLNIFEQEHHITLNQQANSKLVQDILKFDTGITPLINISVISSLILKRATALAKYCDNKLAEKRAFFDQELTTILNTFTARSYYQNIETDLNTYKEQTLNNIMDRVQELGNVTLSIYEIKDKINYPDLIQNYKSHIKKMFLAIEAILDNKLFLKAKIAILYQNKIINATIFEMLNAKLDNIKDFASYQELEDALVKIAPRLYNMYKKKILAKVQAEDLVFGADNVEEYFKILDEYAPDNVTKCRLVMEYLTTVNLNDSVGLIIATLENFDIIKSQNHKF